MSWIYLDKPMGIRSVQCLNIIKEHLKVKCGIWGILDKYACGLLPIAIEGSTKNIDQNNEICQKNYIFKIKWGLTTDTGDFSGKIIKSSNYYPSKEEIEKVIPKFIGKIQQVPPIFSNIKINGVRAHKYARKGINVTMTSRHVNIFFLEMISFDKNTATFTAWTSHGTYIRSLANEIAQNLNSEGHIIYLRRDAIKIGNQIIRPNISLKDFRSNHILE